jgi:hypothetical protein
MSNLYNSASAYFLAVFIIILVSNTAVSFGMIFFYHKIFLNSIITIISFKKKAHFYRYFKINTQVFVEKNDFNIKQTFR